MSAFHRFTSAPRRVADKPCAIVYSRYGLEADFRVRVMIFGLQAKAASRRRSFYGRCSQNRSLAMRWADEALEIADDGSNDWMKRQGEDGEVHVIYDHEHIQRSRLRVDTRKWLLSKVLPKVYGDKPQHTGDGGTMP